MAYNSRLTREATGIMENAIAPPKRYVTLRWVGMIPAALAASLVGPMVVAFWEWGSDTGNPSRFQQWWTLILQSIAMGAGFVWAGSYVAPGYKGRVATALAGAAIFGLGGVGVLFLQTHQWSNLIHVLVSACAAASAGYALHQEHG
jgi:hypothetical protein